MARRKFTEVERGLMRDIASNIRILLASRNWTQKELADRVGLSTSVMSDYLTEKTLPTPGSVQAIADAFGVPKGRVDPTFETDGAGLEAKIQFFEELERELGIDLTDPDVQKMLKRAAKVIFIDED
ncbi:helix-turn-helix domain-containing protein [Paenibacillus oryzisoli]|uniref:HTH cro/C1-type domain-containing protein n=1 Tax=Paenibacillus oryzisoli TaxID=1850517 RepID=A0A198AJE0_9BACL|nr:helix-turn-helix transcriptional regulator [Paenibacillus oryzisoli]OAS21166.1 hypothetical protein A8708_30225 [Paenibacillus oryzisoli]